MGEQTAPEQSCEVLLQWHLDLAAQAGEAFVQSDRTGRLVWASPTVTDLIGWRPSELIGRGPAELVHPEDVEHLERAWVANASTEEALTVRWACHGGGYAWLEERGRALPETPGSEPVRMSRLRDVGELVGARADLVEEITHHRSVIEAIMDPFVVLNAVRDDAGSIVDFTFAEANAAACGFNQTTPDVLIGAPLLGRHPAAGLTELFAAYTAIVQEGIPFIRNAWSFPQDLLGGEMRKYDVRAVKFNDGLVQTWRDVTDEVGAAEQVARSEARLRAVMDAMVDPQVLSEPIRGSDGTIEDFAIEEANDLACTYLDVPLERLVGERLRSVAPELFVQDLFQRFTEVADTGVPAVIDDLAYQDRALDQERTVDLRCTQVQGGQVNITWRDVTERQRNRRRLAESEAQLRAIMDAAPVGMARMSRDGRFERVNPALCRMLLHEEEWLRRHGITDVLHPEDLPTHERMSTVVAQGSKVSAAWEERLVRADGHTMWALHSLAAIRDSSGAVASVLGGQPPDWGGRQLREFIHPFDLRTYDEALEQASTGRALIRRARVCSHDGSYHWVEAHLAPFRDESGKVDGVSASMRNVDVEVQALAELDRQARIDTLTGLVTRREALHRIEQAAGTDREPGGRIGVLFCDIDHFKEINDQFGHAAGDAVLRSLATRISESVRLDDVVARIGGDELLVLIAGLHDLAAASEVAEKVRQVATEPISIDGRQVSTSLSIGVTLAQPGEPADSLIARADAAMYQAKSSGRNAVAALAAPETSDHPVSARSD